MEGGFIFTPAFKEFFTEGNTDAIPEATHHLLGQDFEDKSMLKDALEALY